MGLVAATLGLLTLGAYLGRNLSGGGATALFIAGLGAVGYMVQADLSGGYRILTLLLLALIVWGLVSLFVSMPGGNVIYAVLGLVVFGGYTVLDFNRLRSAGLDDAVNIAAGIFLDVVNVFQFFLQLFGRGRD